MFRGYYEVRSWLELFIPFVYGKEELGLARIGHLLKLLGNPHKKFKSIHVAGTSGKGSTCFYIAKLLQHETRNTKHETRIGLHISPHLVDIRERMQVFSNKKQETRNKKHGGLMPMRRFVRLFNEIKPVVEEVQKEQPDLTPSYFEILVAASFLYFAQEKVDWAVVEVGLGGRLDATNVLTPEVSVITNIGLDHTEILGKTIEKIAFEKAGIIKKGVPVVTGCPSTRSARSGSSAPHTSRGAFEVIADIAKKRQAPLITIEFPNQRFVSPVLLRKIDTQKAEEARFLALAAVEAAGVQVNEKALERAYDAKFAGRMEEIDDGVILDGAHNPDKVRFLIEFVREHLTINNLQLTKEKRPNVKGQMSIVLIVAFKKGKDWKRMVDLLVRNLPVKQIMATQFYAVTDMGPTPSQRLRGVKKYQAVEPEEIKSYIETSYQRPVRKFDNSQEAVFEAIQETRNEKQETSLVLVTGSLYLVGEVRTLWKLPQF